MSKHTPGPWFFDQYGHVYGTLDGQQIEGVPGGKTVLHPHVCTPRCIANARLISAAPELLEACLAMIELDDRENDHAVDFHKRMELCELAFQKARTAIAKATGENT